jgi:hypothetical protein
MDDREQGRAPRDTRDYDYRNRAGLFALFASAIIPVNLFVWAWGSYTLFGLLACAQVVCGGMACRNALRASGLAMGFCALIGFVTGCGGIVGLYFAWGLHNAPAPNVFAR